MTIRLTIPDTFKDLVESKTDDELSVLLSQALLLPGIVGQLKMLESIGLSTLQSILDLQKSGIAAPIVQQIKPEEYDGVDDLDSMTFDDLDLSGLDGITDLEPDVGTISNETVFSKLRSQLKRGEDLGV
jgi:hypothetical protein